MQSPRHVFSHPLWQDQCFRDGDKIPLRKAIQEASGAMSEASTEDSTEETQCCVKKVHKLKKLGKSKKRNKCKNQATTMPCSDGFKATLVNGCCDSSMPLDEEYDCLQEGCTPDKSQSKKEDGIFSKFSNKAKEMTSKALDTAAKHMGTERTHVKAKRLMYEVSGDRPGPHFGEVIARAHGLLSTDTTVMSGDTEICEGVDDTELKVPQDKGCAPGDVNRLIAQVEFRKREKECDGLKSKYLSIWNKLARGSPTNMGGLAAIMQHGYRMKKDSNEFDTTVEKNGELPADNMAVYYLCARERTEGDMKGSKKKKKGGTMIEENPDVGHGDDAL